MVSTTGCNQLKASRSWRYKQVSTQLQLILLRTSSDKVIGYFQKKIYYLSSTQASECKQHSTYCCISLAYETTKYQHIITTHSQSNTGFATVQEWQKCNESQFTIIQFTIIAAGPTNCYEVTALLPTASHCLCYIPRVI